MIGNHSGSALAVTRPGGIRRERARGKAPIKAAMKTGHKHEKDPKQARGDEGRKWEVYSVKSAHRFPKHILGPADVQLRVLAYQKLGF